MLRLFRAKAIILVYALILWGCGSIDDERPVALAGPDQTVLVGTTVHLDAGASFSPVREELFFRWTLQERPEGSAAALADPEAPATTFFVDVEGVYSLHLSVSDGTLASEDVLSVQAVGPDPFAPSADAGPDQEVVPGALVLLDGSASRAPEGGLLTFHWITLERPRESRAALSDPNSPRPNFFADARGIYRFQLTVVTGSGRRSSDIVSVFAGTIPVPLPPSIVGKGQLIYDAQCAICHSLRPHDPSSGGAPDLLLRGWRMEAVFEKPHAGIVLKPEEMDAVRNFIDSI